MLRLLFCVWVICLHPLLPLTGDQTANETIALLLREHWEKSNENRIASENVFEEAAQRQAGDASTLLAYTLNRIQHNRNQQALATATELTTNYPANLDGWVLRLWLETVTDNFDRALVAMQSMKRQLRSQGQLKPETETDIYRRLGRLIGYMQGPVNRQTHADTLNSTIAAIADGMSEHQLKLFNSAREEVLQQFEQLLEVRNETEKTEKADAQVAANEKTKLINQQNDALEQQRQQLAPQVDQLRTEQERQIEALRIRTEPAERRMADLTAQIRAAEYDLQFLYSDFAFVQSLLRRDPHNVSLRQRLDFLSFDIRNREFNLAGLRSSARATANQLAAANAELARLQTDFQARIAAVNQELKQLDRKTQRNFKELDKLAKGPVVQASKIESIKNRTDALTTYDPFPTELFRQHLLETLIVK